MQILINPADELPIYRQIMRQIVEAIAGGRLQGGEQLTSHRELSEQLVIAPLTVKKAYDELEKLGYLETQRGRGTFVVERIPRRAHAEQVSLVAEAAGSLLSKAYLAGLELDEVIELLRDADQRITEGKPQRSTRRSRSA